MKALGIFIVLTFSFWLSACTALYDRLGGPYEGEPGEAFKSGVLNKHANDLIIKAFEGFENQEMHDFHLHFVGNGTESLSCPELNLPKNQTQLNFEEIAHQQDWWVRPFIKGVLLDTADIADESHGDEQYFKRLVDLVAAYGSPKYASHPSESSYRTVFHLLAFDGKYDWEGNLEPSSIFYVSNPYIVKVTNCLNKKLKSSGGFNTNEFKAVGSINPLQTGSDGHKVMRDKSVWLPEMNYLSENHVEWIKWRPSSMNLDPDLVSEEFYLALRDRNIGILTHTGDSTGVKLSDELNKLAAPNKLERAIKLGVKVVMLHMGRAGDGYSEQFFSLLKRFCKDNRVCNLFGEMSAIPYDDSADQLEKIVDKGYKRILNGSDYPIISPYIFVRKSLKNLKNKGYISEDDNNALDQIYHYNPLLFDFVLKRSLNIKGKKLAENLFLNAN